MHLQAPVEFWGNTEIPKMLSAKKRREALDTFSGEGATFEQNVFANIDLSVDLWTGLMLTHEGRGSPGLSAWRTQRTKSRCIKGLQLTSSCYIRLLTNPNPAISQNKDDDGAGWVVLHKASLGRPSCSSTHKLWRSTTGLDPSICFSQLGRHMSDHGDDTLWVA